MEKEFAVLDKEAGLLLSDDEGRADVWSTRADALEAAKDAAAEKPGENFTVYEARCAVVCPVSAPVVSQLDDENPA